MPNITLADAKNRIDLLINKSRVDLYKPIQIAEVLYKHRTEGKLDPSNKETYRKESKHWRDKVTKILIDKVSTSSARFQDDVWNDNAMSPAILIVLAKENKEKNGVVEKYIYYQFKNRQEVISKIFDLIKSADPTRFNLVELLKLFIREPGIRRSIDKAYEIIVYALFETIIEAMQAEISIKIPIKSKGLLTEFADLAKKLIGIEPNTYEWRGPAKLYRVGVTNAADRGLDMWANFGPAIQVKHLTLNGELAKGIVDQVESDHIVVVCQDADASIIDTIAKQIGWGKRVRGIVTQSELIKWYDKCLHGGHSEILAKPLLRRIHEQFSAEFPHNMMLDDFVKSRGYDKIKLSDPWKL